MRSDVHAAFSLPVREQITAGCTGDSHKANPSWEELRAFDWAPGLRRHPLDHQARIDDSFYSGCRCSLALTARPSRISSAKLPARSTAPQISPRSARIPSIPEPSMDRPGKPLASSLASSCSTRVEQMCLMLTPSSAAAISRRRSCRAAPAPGVASRRSGEQRPHLRCPLAAHALLEQPSGSTRRSQRQFRSS